MVRRGRKDRRGFALVDVIVGAVILGTSLVVVVGLAGQAVTAQVRGQDLATAAGLADEQLQLVLAHGPDDYERRFQSQGRCDEPFDDYSFAVKVSGTGQTTPYEVSATISWTRAWGEQSLTIRTLVASRIVGEDFESDPDRRPETPIQRILE
jgi:type II secretory pathway pseudopilin PulG